MEQKDGILSFPFDISLPSTSRISDNFDSNYASQSGKSNLNIKEVKSYSSNDSSSGSEKEDEQIDYSEPERNQLLETDKYQDNDCISQFLSGSISFNEYAQKMNVLSVDEDDNFSNMLLDDSSLKLVANLEIEPHKPKKKKRRKFVRRNLPPALKGLMGEANLRYARGDNDEAIKMCFEVIRQVPTAPEPYQTLAGLYEETGHSDKALQMSLIAAHLSPSDVNQWIHLAEMLYVKGNVRQAIMCYTKALRADERNIEVHFKRAELLEKVNLKYIALKGFSKLLTVLDPEKEGDKILELSKLVAEMYHKEKDLEKTRKTLEIAFEKCPSLVTSEHVNLLLEVLLSLKDYTACLETLIQFCDISVEFESRESGLIVVDTCVVPKDMAIDLKVKLIVTLIHFKSLKPVYILLESLDKANVDEIGDLYLDVAEAFMVEGFYDDAIPLYVSLVYSKSYSLPAVWLNYAECLQKADHIEESIKAYLHVIEAVPEHNSARLIVCELLTNLGRKDEALDVLIQDEKCGTIDSEVLYKKCLLLKDKPEHLDDYIAAVQLFLSRHLFTFTRLEELRTISNLRVNCIAKKKAAIKDVRLLVGIQEQNVTRFQDGKNMPSAEKEWELFMDICNICFYCKRFPTLQRLALSAQGSELFTAYNKEIDLLCLLSSFYNKDSYMGYNYARQLVLKDLSLIQSWNLFNLSINRGDDTRHNKFIMRLLARNQSHKMLSILHANNCLVSGTYKYALNEFVSIYRKDKSPLITFLIGVTLSQMACQKFSAKKHSLVTQAIAFFSKYRDLRGPGGEQEYHYNLGRVYHQLGLLPSALHYYKMALECKPTFINGSSESFDLCREAAFNLHLIYLQSGAADVARMYLEKYIVI